MIGTSKVQYLNEDGESASPPYDFAFKPVNTWSARERKWRIFRVMWTNGEGAGTTREGYAARFSVGFQDPREYGWVEVCGEDSTRAATKKHWRFKCLGLVLHYRRSYGSWPV